MGSVRGVVERLVAKQAALGLGNEEMASRLGVTVPTWWRVRRGHVVLSRRVLVGAARQWPEDFPELAVLFAPAASPKRKVSA